LKYSTVCTACNLKLDTKGFNFNCPNKCDSLSKNVYASKKLEFKDHPGIWRYLEWLPVEKATGYAGKSVTFRSKKFGKELGLKNLYVSFTGYWPEMGCDVKTCTFKEFEAVVAVQHARESGVSRVIVASAGSTANAFAYMGSLEKFRVVLVVPLKVADQLAAPLVDQEFVTTIAVDGEYCDAISYAEMLHRSTGIAYDGGGRSPVRRDAAGTVMLAAAEKLGAIPNHYFQAISSGAGAIAAKEEVDRLADDGRFGKPGFKVHFSQNEPFVPVVKAWEAGSRQIEKGCVPNTLDALYAKVLSNGKPLYGISGGLFDALKSTSGETYGVTKRQAEDAAKAFEQLEGIDIHPAAAVAAASLVEAASRHKIGADETVMLNLTGGGLRRAGKELGMQKVPIKATVGMGTPVEDLKEVL